MEPGASAGMVARWHGLSRGQFYAWRQDLVLCGALGAGAAAGATSRLEGGETTTAASRGAVTVPAPRASDILATPVAPPPPVQTDRDIMLTGGVSAPANEGCGDDDAAAGCPLRYPSLPFALAGCGKRGLPEPALI
jgi:hypothetical protein